MFLKEEFEVNIEKHIVFYFSAQATTDQIDSSKALLTAQKLVSHCDMFNVSKVLHYDLSTTFMDTYLQ